MSTTTVTYPSATTTIVGEGNGESYTYMLWRDKKESQRLDFQHNFFKELFGGHIFHPQVPLQNVKNVADVGTGTGSWLIDAAATLQAKNSTSSRSLIGFDISSTQFHEDPSVEYVVHDASTPFPEKYLNFFDVVHVRLVSYGIRADKIQDTVRNVTSIVKPGGYIYWEEADIIDTIVTPESQASRRRMALIVEERLARGLTPAIVKPLVTTMTTLRTDNLPSTLTDQTVSLHPSNPDTTGTFSPLTWNNNDILRLLDLSTVSTATHPSRQIQSQKKQLLTTVYTTFLEIGAARKRKLAGEGQGLCDAERERLLNEAAEMESYVDHPDLRAAVDDAEFTRILAKKAIMVPREGPWNTAMLS